MWTAARLRRSAALGPLIDRLRPHYRSLRTAYLRRRYPRGGYVWGNGVRVFADFSEATYEWYDADGPHLALEMRVLGALAAHARGDVWIDVGAHFGFVSAVMARLLQGRPGATLIAIEPDPRSFRCLERTLADAPVPALLLPLAAGDRDGVVELFATPEAPCLHTYADGATTAVGEVACLRLDTIVARHVPPGARVGLIKVDIDGAEPGFLRGAEATLAGHRPIVVIEFCPVLLRRAGFEPRAVYDDLVRRFAVAWIEEGRVRWLGAGDYEALARAVGDRITDLVLAPEALDLRALDTADV